MSENRKPDDFTKGYIEAVLSSTDFDSKDSEPFDENHDILDLSDETYEKMVADCEVFQKAYGHLWVDKESGSSEWNIDEQAGHDFWLTRNGHWRGFWDRPEIYGQEATDVLTEACEHREVYLYKQDGKIHCESC